MSRPHEGSEVAADWEAAKAFFDGSETINSVSNWGEGKYQFDGFGNVFLTKGIHLIRMPVCDFVGGVAYSLGEHGNLSIEKASPNHVATVCFELGILITKHEVGHVSVGPFA